MDSSLADRWFTETLDLLRHVRNTNSVALRQAASLVGPSLAAGGVLHAFGSGHSEIVAREIQGRAGGLICVSGILDPTGGTAENVPGYGRMLAERHARIHGMHAGECVVVISNSGRNCAPIDVALFAREHGLHVIGVCALAMAREVSSRHPSGRNLPDVAEIVLDNGGVSGDARLPLPDGSGVKTGATSTFTGALLLDLLQLETIEWLSARGHPLPVLRSQNTDTGADHNRPLAERYRARLSRPL